MFMFDQVNIKVKGVIENMSWFTGDDGKQYHLFGSGGGKDLADRLEVDLIGQVPMTMPMREVPTRAVLSWPSIPRTRRRLRSWRWQSGCSPHGPSKRTHPELKING